MVFGELVDTVPIFGSQRKAYIMIGAALMAAGLITLAGAAGRWLAFARTDHLYVIGAMLIAIGTVVQDVVADAMSTEVVDRVRRRGPRAPRQRRARRARHGAGAGAARGVGRRSRRRRPVRLARQCHVPRAGVPDRPCHSDDLGRGRVSARHRDDGAAADRLAHSRRRHRVRRRRGDPRRRRHAVRSGDHLPDLDGGRLLHAGAGHRRTRSQHADGHPVRHHHRVRVSRHARGGRRLFLVDARRTELRRRVLRHAPADRRDPVDRRDVAVQPAS